MDALLYSLCALFFSSCGSSDLAEPLSAAETRAGQRLIQLKTTAIDEASGLAASSRSNHLWVHNDSGSDAEIHLVNVDAGELAQTVAVNDAEAYDWEDMAAFSRNGKPWLLIADIGDNSATRAQLNLYAFPEPSEASTEVTPVLNIRFHYEDGPRDCEAVAVEGSNVWLLTKRDKPPRLYHLPLMDTQEPVTAKIIGEVHSIPAPTAEDLAEDPRYGKHRSRVTAMSFSRDGQKLLLTTYKDSYLYSVNSAGWLAALNQTPLVIDVPQMAQTEAGAFSGDGGIWIASEQLPTQLFYSPLR